MWHYCQCRLLCIIEASHPVSQCSVLHCPGCECLCSGRVWNQRRTVWVGSCGVWGLMLATHECGPQWASPEINNELHSDQVAPQLAPPHFNSQMSGKCPTSQRNIHHDDDEVWSSWWLGVSSSQNCEIGFVLWCNPWSCEPSESYGNIMRGKWPSPNMPWSGPNFNTAPIKLPNLREKLTVAEGVRLVGNILSLF